MTKLKIRIAPDPILRQKSQPIKVTEVYRNNDSTYSHKAKS